METKACRNCNEVKPLDAFLTRMLAKGLSHRHICKACDNKRRQENPTPNRAEKMKLAEARRKAGIPAPSRKTTAEQKRIVARDSEYRRLYGITYQDYLDMSTAQNGRCKICNDDPSEVYKGSHRRLFVDHCHSTGRVRGLLCVKCNFGIAMFYDDTNRLEKAINYLQ